MNEWGLHHKIKQHEGPVVYDIGIIQRCNNNSHFVAFYKLKIAFSCLTFCDFCNHPLDSKGCVPHFLTGKAEPRAGERLSREEQRWKVRTIPCLWYPFPFLSLQILSQTSSSLYGGAVCTCEWINDCRLQYINVWNHCVVHLKLTFQLHLN